MKLKIVHREKINILLMLLFLGVSSVANSQLILLDEGVQAGGLWCFPINGEPHSYKYLPSRARLALDENSLPEFSFIRYVLEKPSGATASSMTQAGGGGVLHFLVLYDTPEEQVGNAQDELREILQNEDVILKGPIIFDRGRYALISSILIDEGKSSKRMIASGEAPVLENSKIALSFDIDPVESKLLLESFKMAIPDVSLVFELIFSGLTDSYEAVLDIDWEKIKISKSFGASGNLFFLKVDVEKGFDELIQNQAIKLTSAGSNASMEGLLNTVYSKLLEFMFQPIEATKFPTEEKGGIQDAMAASLGSKGGLNNKNSSSLGIGISYRLKQLKSSGTAKLNFSGRSLMERNHYITFNIGDLYKKYGDDERLFRDIPLWDPAFQQMRVFVGVDGSLEREFEQMVNNVTVTLKKVHTDGFVTTKQVMVNRNIFLDSLGNLSMTYLNHKDSDLLEWMKYDYSTQWQFKGGGTYTTGWIRDSTSMINLYAPFRRQKIALEGDSNVLINNSIRAVVVQIRYPFFGETKKERLIVRPEDDIHNMGFEITLPNEVEEVDYSVTWIKTDGARKELSGKDRYGILFIDELPQN